MNDEYGEMRRTGQNKAIDVHTTRPVAPKPCAIPVGGSATSLHQRPEAKLVSQYQDWLKFRYPRGQKISYATETIAYFIASLALSSIQVRKKLSVPGLLC